ncbi:uncharacterized protein K02A2.6-like [Rhipicephalus sanguineus]|uniref:uncharacterized protein K02A2.6-like n=1 Tax=Rhipicephalus sanguineus TaxID=34632 RepID=UPI0020C38D43|nr:uncharacterized protein K02A2.6-like [Rhipicephalus sanguineus]
MALKLPDFAEETDKWQAYLVKIDACFEANEVTDDAKKRALLVAALGSRTVEILCGRIAPRKPSSLSYEEVVSTLNEYYDPSPNEISESFKFFHRNQQEGESVQAFIVEIRKLAHNCNFSSMLERMLRDRIVCGVRSKNLQKQLLAKKDLTLAEAEALALAAESAELGSQQMTGQGDTVGVFNIPVRGVVKMQASYKSATVDCDLVVLDCEGPSLCGRDLLQMLETQGAPLLHIASLSSDGKLESRTAAPVMQQYADLFAEGLGTIKGPPARLHIKDGATPRFCKARKIPFSLLDKVSAELDRLVAEGIITPVSYSEWATPVVPVLKRDGTVRICGDFKVTLNPVCEMESYPLPVVDDIFATLRGGQQFSILDLRDAYNQILLDEDSRKLAVINTHRGLFCYNRLPFGIASAPAIFQRTIEQVLQGLPGVQAYLDDVLIADANDKPTANLQAVLQRFREYGVKLRSDKCRIGEESVTYLGHRIDAAGLHPSEKNIEAIKLAPTPRNVTELRSFLGMLTFYNKFLPNLSTLLSPLYLLLEKKSKWSWDERENDAFRKAKAVLCSAPVLTHFDPARELFLECDASPYGVGAALFHRIEGQYQPLGFRSRTLTAAEKNYSQIEREALALVYGVTRFRDYLLGRQFTLLTDHQPLLGLLRADRQTPAMAAARIQRWAIILGAYRYRLQHRPGKLMCNADALSRLPQPLQEEADQEEEAQVVLTLDQWDQPALPWKELQALAVADEVLFQVRKYTREGWPKKLDMEAKEIADFYKKRHELSVSEELLYWGHRLVVPTAARGKLLRLLHEAHQGVSTMKAKARSLFWWPGVDQDIERIAATCQNCVQALPMPQAKEPANWPETHERWSRLHVDYAGPIKGKMLLIVVDAHTKWIEALPVSQANSHSTVEALRTIFSRFGIPRTVVSDNGTPFTVREFERFMERNGIAHIRTPPYHPQSNGLAERAVRTIKDGLKKMGGTCLITSLARVLCNYRNAPHQEGLSPSERLLGYRLRTRMEMSFPSRVYPAKATSDPGWNFAPGDYVYVRNYGAGDKWSPGTVEATRGTRLLEVKTVDGLVRRHVDQVHVWSSVEHLDQVYLP